MKREFRWIRETQLRSILRNRYEVIVIGGGHAGVEAAWAAANALEAGAGDAPSIALVTMDPSRIGTMSCNPAIGGLAKGQMVREIDALGGVMALATDATGIQFRVLNMSKGAAVRGPRAQCDKYAYASEVQRLLATQRGMDVIVATIDDLIVEDGRIAGVTVPAGAGVVRAADDAPHLRGEAAQPLYPSKPDASAASKEPRRIDARAVVLTTGTFMRGLMHTGEAKSRGGRVGEGSAEGISGTLRRLGFELGRLKTGTPPRLAAESIDFSATIEQTGDAPPRPFSDLSPAALPGGRFPLLPQVSCFATHTTARAHDAIRANLHRAPMYSGDIEAECGPRYCPSIEDKVVRFAERMSHHVFLEPESLHTDEIYCNGISTSLPRDVQEIIVRTMPGCADAIILRLGYAVEYDMVWPHQIDATGMTKRIEGLFLAGQINGTSGYEEAAGQGLVAGLNAARFAAGAPPVALRRDQAYIGVMMDDLVTRTPREPYRMFTSRAEHRLLLRPDNADARLTPLGRELGLVDDVRWHAWMARRDALEATLAAMRAARIDGKTLAEIARRPEMTVADLRALLAARDPRFESGIDDAIIERAMIEVQYEGYLSRQEAEVRRQREAERRALPRGLDYHAIAGLRREAAEALDRFRPATMGQAGRLAGVTPADLTLLTVALRKRAEQAAQPA